MHLKFNFTLFPFFNNPLKLGYGTFYSVFTVFLFSFFFHLLTIQKLVQSKIQNFCGEHFHNDSLWNKFWQMPET